MKLPAPLEDRKLIYAHSRIHDEVKYIMNSLLAIKSYYYNAENLYICDFGDEDRKFVIDIDGPSHFFRESRNRKGLRRLIGQIDLKYRLLTAAGWKIVSVPYYQWNSYHDELEKSLYLKRKLKLNGLLN